MATSDARRLLFRGGLVIAVAVALPQIARWATGHVPFDGVALVWCAAYVVFAAAYLLASAPSLGPRRRRALVVIAVGDTRFEGALLCVVAAEAPLVAGDEGFLWVVAQSAGMAIVEGATPFHGHRLAVVTVIVFAGFQLFAYGASRIAAREASARAELARVHAELLATRELFADGTRAAERLRIAREVHDALGHHLTALSLQLELAHNLAEGPAEEPVEQARAVTKELLAELRSVVSTLREEAPLDLPRALRTLVEGIPHPSVHLEIDRDLRVEASLAHTIFRCVQEALTNAIRHAAARNVYLTIAARDATVTITARDDGRGAVQVRPGNGLRGLRERIEGMGGSMEIEARQGSGVTLRALLPARAGTA